MNKLKQAWLVPSSLFIFVMPAASPQVIMFETASLVSN